MFADIEQVERFFQSDNAASWRFRKASIEELHRGLNVFFSGEILWILAANREAQHITNL